LKLPDFVYGHDQDVPDTPGRQTSRADVLVDALVRDAQHLGGFSDRDVTGKIRDINAFYHARSVILSLFICKFIHQGILEELLTN